MSETGIRKYFPVKRVGDDGRGRFQKPPLCTGKRARSGSAELPTNLAGGTSSSASVSSYDTSANGTELTPPPSKRMKSTVGLPFAGEQIEAGASAPMSGARPQTPPERVNPASEPPFTREFVKANPTSTPVSGSQPSHPPERVNPAVESPLTGEPVEARPLSASSSGRQPLPPSNKRMKASVRPSFIRESVEARPVSRKRSRSPSPSASYPSPVNIRKIVPLPLPPTKRARLQSTGEASSLQSPVSESIILSTRFGAPAQSQRRRVSGETLMRLIGESRLYPVNGSATPSMPEQASGIARTPIMPLPESQNLPSLDPLHSHPSSTLLLPVDHPLETPLHSTPADQPTPSFVSTDVSRPISHAASPIDAILFPPSTSMLQITETLEAMGAHPSPPSHTVSEVSVLTHSALVEWPATVSETSSLTHGLLMEQPAASSPSMDDSVPLSQIGTAMVVTTSPPPPPPLTPSQP